MHAIVICSTDNIQTWRICAIEVSHAWSTDKGTATECCPKIHKWVQIEVSNCIAWTSSQEVQTELQQTMSLSSKITSLDYIMTDIHCTIQKFRIKCAHSLYTTQSLDVWLLWIWWAFKGICICTYICVFVDFKGGELVWELLVVRKPQHLGGRPFSVRKTISIETKTSLTEHLKCLKT